MVLALGFALIAIFGAATGAATERTCGFFENNGFTAAAMAAFEKDAGFAGKEGFVARAFTMGSLEL